MNNKLPGGVTNRWCTDYLSCFIFILYFFVDRAHAFRRWTRNNIVRRTSSFAGRFSLLSCQWIVSSNETTSQQSLYIFPLNSSFPTSRPLSRYESSAIFPNKTDRSTRKSYVGYFIRRKQHISHIWISIFDDYTAKILRCSFLSVQFYVTWRLNEVFSEYWIFEKENNLIDSKKQIF